MKNNFLLSIVIPTRNREKYALGATELILKMNDERIQVVIQDNSDTNLLSDMLKNYKNDDCLKYNYTGERISPIDNFNLAIDLSDGEYICIIGDDDGIINQIVDIVKWAKENNIDAIKPATSIGYFWPNSGALGGKKDNGNLSISKTTLKAYICNPYNEVKKMLNIGPHNYLSLNLVKLYHGVVRKSCLNNLKNITGKYIGGLSPDIYISLALSLTIEKVIIIDFPLTISGICSKSTAADSITGRHTGRLEDAPHFRGQDNYKWSELIPKFYSVETIWADSALNALRDINQSDMLKYFNLEYFLIHCLIKYPQFRRMIIKHYNSCSTIIGRPNAKKLITVLTFPIIKFIKKVLCKIKRRRDDYYQINGIDNITMANEAIQRRFAEKGINIKMVIELLDNLR